MSDNKKLAKKILTRQEWEDYKSGKDKTTVKGKPEKIDTHQVKKKTNIEEFAKRNKLDASKVKNTTDKIDTKEIVKVKDAQAVKDREGLRKIQKAAEKLKSAGQGSRADDLIKKAMESKAFKRIAKSAAKKTLKSIPIVGGLASAIMSKDASAAVPVLSEAEEAGPSKGSLEAKMEDPSLSAEQRYKIQQKLKEKFKKNK
jgi:hypothetical protein